ncbi:putative bifunctional diguanylate cyclase/phosphodiesterase [Marinomonas balearica]|uniref:PAS domain S-box-containing protein/diguanylate cyclase (GGDEF)-like protein n=1 Tax=Marinomonas balearica TaxID=491947 RepID=A0A4V3CGX6_9GAMM|nr:EAL domain-containing protein [Marinomonas balearica]TDO99452.1 PAS domain S-box-containing protein/diguanylate cyclase (GGDEF)-like protein [Marinomonas balearica]
MKNFDFSQSLYLKQAVLTFLLAIFLSVALSCLQFYQVFEYQKKQRIEQVNQLLDVIEEPLEQALFRIDKVLAQKQINSLLSRSNISQVTILDENNIEFVASRNEPSNLGLSSGLVDLLIGEDSEQARPLAMISPQLFLGTIKIRLDRSSLAQQILLYSFSVFIQNLFKDLILASLISLLFYYVVTRPVEQLTKALSNIQGTDHLMLPKSFNKDHEFDELGRLKKVFSGLWERLSKALNDVERSNLHSKAMINHAADAILVLNESGQITLSNAAAENLTGLTSYELTRTKMSSLYDDPWISMSEILADMHLNQSITIETFFVSKEKRVPVEIRIAKYEIHKVIEIVLLVRDITERKRAEERINRLAFYDSLTRLPNRHFFVERLNELLDELRLNRRHAALIMFDLDRFKNINDSLGHNVGDELLCKVVGAITPLLPERAMFARIGGDEFAILLPEFCQEGVGANQPLIDISKDILARCNTVKKVGEFELHVSASIGICLFDGSIETSTSILKQADSALYRAKELGRNTFEFYEDNMQAISDENLKMERALFLAMENEDFELYYQPQNDASGRLIGAEALIRWNESEQGFISPAKFIPIAEEMGLIVELGEWVLHQALKDVSRWRSLGLWDDSLQMSVNVSPIQFQHAGFMQMLKSAIDKFDVPAHCLDLEITENTLLSDSNASLDLMYQVRSLGVRLSIDDFGTGYSSLKYLKSLPIGRLKIDQSFVRDLLNDHSDEVIVLTIIAMAKALDIDVLAEGVETKTHQIRLEEMDCTLYQGYYFDRPSPAHIFSKAWLES